MDTPASSSRNGEGHYETVTLADHATGAPFAVLNFHDQGGEIAATQDLLQRCDITGHVITVDALHTTRKTASLITQTADDVVTVKGHAPDTCDILKTIDWDRTRQPRAPEHPCTRCRPDEPTTP